MILTKLKKERRIASELAFWVIKIKEKKHFVSKNTFKKQVDILLSLLLLLLEKKDKKHYALLKDFNTFMYDHSFHRERKHFCR